MGIDIKDLKGFKIKGLDKEEKPIRYFDVLIVEKTTGKIMCYYQRDMPEVRAINYQRKAYEGLGTQDEYEVKLIEKNI